MATILVNELSAYEFRTYGTRHGGSMLASTHLDVLLMLMFVITLHSLSSSRSFSQAIFRRLYLKVV